MEKIKRGIIIFWIIVCFLLTLGSLYIIYRDWQTEKTQDSEEVLVTTMTDTSTTQLETTLTTTSTTTTTMTTSIETATEESLTTTSPSIANDVTENMTYLGLFIGTYFRGETVPCNGGSGRELIDCKPKPGTAKGSVAAKYVVDNFGYDINTRTLIWIEFSDYPEMNGWYSVDDYNADAAVVDFYFPDYSQCPWENDGVTPVKVWIN